MQDRRLLTVGEVADQLAVHKASVFRLIGRGELHTLKIGRTTRIAVAEVDAFLDRLSSSGRTTSPAAANSEEGADAGRREAD